MNALMIDGSGGADKRGKQNSFAYQANALASSGSGGGSATNRQHEGILSPGPGQYDSLGSLDMSGTSLLSPSLMPGMHPGAMLQPSPGNLLSPTDAYGRAFFNSPDHDLVVTGRGIAGLHSRTPSNGSLSSQGAGGIEAPRSDGANSLGLLSPRPMGGQAPYGLYSPPPYHQMMQHQSQRPQSANASINASRSGGINSTQALRAQQQQMLVMQQQMQLQRQHQMYKASLAHSSGSGPTSKNKPSKKAPASRLSSKGASGTTRGSSSGNTKESATDSKSKGKGAAKMSLKERFKKKQLRVTTNFDNQGGSHMGVGPGSGGGGNGGGGAPEIPRAPPMGGLMSPPAVHYDPFGQPLHSPLGIEISHWPEESPGHQQHHFIEVSPSMQAGGSRPFSFDGFE